MKIWNTTCELNICYHCNLSCRSCGHFSPHLSPYFARPEVIHHDLSILSDVYHVEHINLCGGEPLLNPKLLEIIYIVKNTRIADNIELVTNGLLLSKAEEAIWENIDRLTISVYPETEKVISKKIPYYQQKVKEYGIQLELRYMYNFREVFIQKGISDKSLVQRIYNTCKNAHIGRCHNIDRGYFYKCPQSVFIPIILNREFINDKIKIEPSDDFKERLIEFIESKTPLECCSYCLGSVGRLVPHRQIKPEQERENWNRPIDDLLDLNQLSRLEENPNAPDYYRIKI